MARISHADKAARFYRAGKQPLDPPKRLSTRAKAIWREIVASKPVDWFDGGSLGMLAGLCETGARLEECWRRLARFPFGCVEARYVMTELRTLQANYDRAASKLRLTVQAIVDNRSAKAAESAPEAEGDALIGGEAARRFRVVS